MKKLLALILCVMMFVSVLSTNAFADQPTISAHPDRDTGTLAPIPNAAANNKAIKNAKANIEYMYGALAADNAVFGTIQSVDSVISNLAKEMFKDVDWAFGLPGSKLESNTKTVLRDYIGSAIVNYLEDHSNKFESVSKSFRAPLANGSVGGLTYTGKTTSTGDPIYIDADGTIYAVNGAGWWVADKGTNVTEAQHDDISGIGWTATQAVTTRYTYKYDPIAYANTFADAVNDAFNSKDGASMLQALAYQLYSVKVYDELDSKFDDLYNEIRDWEDGSAILSQYHFHDTLPNGWFDGVIDNDPDVFTPYALMDLDNYPNAISINAAILAP
jgi:hypothetical protein